MNSTISSVVRPNPYSYTISPSLKYFTVGNPCTLYLGEEDPMWGQLMDKACPKNNPVYPYGLDPFYFSEVEIEDFTDQHLQLRLKYICITPARFDLAYMALVSRSSTTET